MPRRRYAPCVLPCAMCSSCAPIKTLTEGTQRRGVCAPSHSPTQPYKPFLYFPTLASLALSNIFPIPTLPGAPPPLLWAKDGKPSNQPPTPDNKKETDGPRQTRTTLPQPAQSHTHRRDKGGGRREEGRRRRGEERAGKRRPNNPRSSPIPPTPPQAHHHHTTHIKSSQAA